MFAIIIIIIILATIIVSISGSKSRLGGGKKCYVMKNWMIVAGAVLMPMRSKDSQEP